MMQQFRRAPRLARRSVTLRWGALLLGAALPPPAGATPVLTAPLPLHLELGHTPPTGSPYASVVDGVFTLNVVEDTTGTATATLVLGHEGCFAMVSWQTTGSQPGLSGGLEACLADPAVTESDFGAWMAGARTPDPSLRIPLAPAPSPPGALTNPFPADAQVLVRGCGVDAFRRAADLHLAPAALMVQRSVNSYGLTDYTLAASGVGLDVVASALWSDVLGACRGTPAGLPTTPVFGTGGILAGTTQLPAPDPASPADQIEVLRQTIGGFLASEALTRGRAGSLSRKLDRSEKKLGRAKTAAAGRVLGRFEGQAQALDDAGALPPGAAAGLIAQSGAARALIDLIGVAPPRAEPDPDAACDPAPAVCPDALCALTTYHVDATPSRGVVPDGSAGAPFPSIADALARAAADGACGAILRLAPGEYPGDVTLDRHLRLLGSDEGRTVLRGTVTNAGAFELVVDDVTIDTDGRGVSVSNPCARTTITDVQITRPVAYGIVHRGGTVEVRDTIVLGTISEPDNQRRGTAVLLSCGAQAVLEDVRLDDNDAGGLHVMSDGTRVVAEDLDVARTGVHPEMAADPCADGVLYGAVQVVDGAVLDVEGFTIASSTGAGLRVAGAGTRATLRVGTVTTTRAIDAPDCSGGDNVVATDGGSIRMESFASRHADRCGVYLARGGEIDLEDGEVARNVIGACVRNDDVPPEFDLARLQKDVEYDGNDRALDADALPVPEAGSLDEE